MIVSELALCDKTAKQSVFEDRGSAVLEYRPTLILSMKSKADCTALDKFIQKHAAYSADYFLLV